jgi:hypothetical protein
VYLIGEAFYGAFCGLLGVGLGVGAERVLGFQKGVFYLIFFYIMPFNLQISPRRLCICLPRERVSTLEA